MEINNDEQMIPCLIDLGCSDEMIHAFKESYQKKDINKQIQILKSHRCVLLEKIHADQKQIDCVDYLLYTIKKNNVCKEAKK